jgi:hypothetical protein
VVRRAAVEHHGVAAAGAEIATRPLQLVTGRVWKGTAARTLGLQLRIANANTERDFDAAFATLSQGRVGGLVIGTDGFLVSQSALLATRDLPISRVRHGRRTDELRGSVTDSYRLSGAYTGRILKGEKPADLPVQQATKVELIINLRTAKALGATDAARPRRRGDRVNCPPAFGRPWRMKTVSPWPISAFWPDRHTWQSSHGFLFSL